MHTIDRILISRLRFMGDIILTTPLLHQLRLLYPQAEITYLAEAPFHTLLQNHPHVDRILAYRPSHTRDQLKLYFTLLNETFDLAIDLFGNPRSGLMMFLSGAAIRIGGDFRLRRRFYTHRIADDGKRKSAIDFHRQYLRPLSPLLPPAVPPSIVVTDAERRWAIDFLDRQGRRPDKKLIGIHPGASWPAKMWPADRFAALVRQLAQDSDLQILLTAGPAEIERLDAIRNEARAAALVAQSLDLRQLAAVLQQTDVFVSNDCGPLHLAPAVGSRVVGIFGPGEPDIWFPYAPERGHRLVYHTLDCSHCHRDRCEKLDCMKAITVTEVVQAVFSSIQHEERNANL